MTSNARDILRQLFHAEILAGKGMLSENKRSLLITTPIWLAGISLMSAGIVYGFGSAASLIIERSDAAQANAAALSISYFVLIALFILMFLLALEKTWPDMLDERHFEPISNKHDGLSDREVFAIIGFRFFKTTFFSISPLLCLIIFGVAPLFALGMAMGAPLDYYLLLLPVLYLFSIVPSSSGVLAAVLLSRIFGAEPVTRLFGILNFISIFLILAVFIFGIPLVMPQVTTQITAAEHVLTSLLPLSVTVTSLSHFLLGNAPAGFTLLVWIFVSALVFSGAGLLLTQRVMSRHLTKQENPRTLGKALALRMIEALDPLTAKVSQRLLSSRYGSIIQKEWGDLYVLKTKERRAEIAILFIILVAIYLSGAFILAPEDPASMDVALLVHITITGILAYAGLMFVHSARDDDRPLDEIDHLKGIDEDDLLALAEADMNFAIEEYARFYKACGLNGNEIALCRWLIYSLPAAFGAGLLLLGVNILIGTPAVATIISIAALLLLIAPFTALSLLKDAEWISNRKVSLWGTVRHHLYGAVALTILAPSITNHHSDLFDYSNAIPPQDLAALIDLAFVAISIIVLVYALGKTGREWEKVRA